MKVRISLAFLSIVSSASRRLPTNECPASTRTTELANILRRVHTELRHAVLVRVFHFTTAVEYPLQEK
jgi:hypothetical protein